MVMKELNLVKGSVGDGFLFRRDITFGSFEESCGERRKDLELVG